MAETIYISPRELSEKIMTAYTKSRNGCSAYENARAVYMEHRQEWDKQEFLNLLQGRF